MHLLKDRYEILDFYCGQIFMLEREDPLSSKAS